MRIVSDENSLTPRKASQQQKALSFTRVLAGKAETESVLPPVIIPTLVF